ncbi:hypothetical protein [Novosphingobium sp. 9]|nr:hypothetical protein [Novosphingobium sp. 9]
MRVIDLLVRESRLQQPRRIEIEGTTLHLEPSRFANQIWAWRET